MLLIYSYPKRDNFQKSMNAYDIKGISLNSIIITRSKDESNLDNYKILYNMELLLADNQIIIVSNDKSKDINDEVIFTFDEDMLYRLMTNIIQEIFNEDNLNKYTTTGDIIEKLLIATTNIYNESKR